MIINPVSLEGFHDTTRLILWFLVVLVDRRMVVAVHRMVVVELHMAVVGLVRGVVRGR